ncbi:MAG: hypothetical protein LBN06_04440 [Prevotellaceae bacterium]|jgi:hypothetical protein|nr:hypothetical protein [Prevotellaceae bacterium]
MSIFYENILLREEFNMVQKLQKDAEFAKYVTVQYADRVTGETRSVLLDPTAGKYPEIYIADYHMPVYIGAGQLRNDYDATVRITLSEPVLSNRQADNSPMVNFASNFEPFNNHVHQTAICSGNAWAVAKDNGLWHFIISLGALINQDAFVCAEGSHFNPRAYDYWIQRRRRPVNNIKWPLDLTTRPTVTVISKATNNVEAAIIEKPKIAIVKKPAQQTLQQAKITIIKK